MFFNITYLAKLMAIHCFYIFLMISLTEKAFALNGGHLLEYTYGKNADHTSWNHLLAKISKVK